MIDHTNHQTSTPIVKRPLFSWVWLRSNRKRQALLLVIVLVTVLVRIVPLEMQKRIVDEGIMGRNADLLATYCLIYLVAFLLASSLKYGINALQTIIGQKTLARMRREMLGHILRLPYGFFRNTQSGAVVTTLVTELATAGDFIGVALAVPATNILTNFSRFFIFALGGYLALKGHLAIGSLVAFLSAQEKLYDPWKELIQFYQAYQTASVTYDRAMKAFDDIPEDTSNNEKPMTQGLKGRLELSQVGYRTADGSWLLRDISLKIEAGEHWALVGTSGSGKSTLAHCIVGLVTPSNGRIRLDGHTLSDLTRADISHNIAFVPQKPFVFKGTVAENICYPAPVDWLEAKNGDGRKHRDDCIKVLQQVSLFVDVLGFGLEGSPGPDVRDDLKSAIVAARQQLSQDLPDDLAAHIERFDPKRFLKHASLGENLLFGRVLQDDVIDARRLADIPEAADLLTKAGLREPLIDIGLQIADGLAPYFRHPPLPEYMQRLLPLDMAKIEACLDLRDRVGHNGKKTPLSADEEDLLLLLSMAYVPEQFQLVKIPESLQNGIVALRGKLQALLSQHMPGAVSFYRHDRYIEQADILSNLLFGRVTAHHDEIRRRIGEAINRALIEEELLEVIVEIGLQHQVGTAGTNLSGGQQQKLAIARTLLKRPPVLVFDEATAGLDNASQSRVQDTLVKHWKGRSTLVAVIHRLDILHHYDKVAVMKEGRIVESGSFDDLMEKKEVLHELVTNGQS
ncbi:MAG: ATP-binding cassette domain-containing protein [Deltaproteobacteria bacterium]|nr:ATP-binding cassette domain-containing protein [Deltaproteobacteria bacterium]